MLRCLSGGTGCAGKGLQGVRAAETASSLSGGQVRTLMRRHRKTIRGLSQAMHVTQARVRQVRLNGVSGEAFVRDWLEAIQGQ